MENGGLSEKFGELNIDNAKDNSLFQVMKAVEAAEATIRQQVEENNKLRAELLRRDQELENIKVDKPTTQGYSVDISDEHKQGINTVYQAAQIYDTSGGQTAENANFSQPTSPTLRSPGRFLKNEGYDPSNVPAQRLMPATESDIHSNLWKQIREHEEEIIQLRNHLNDCSIKEAQIRNEKYILEKRIAHMRMAFDQQQQDLVDAASKALSYRQDIIEENVRLTYALQDVQQERTIFVSSLVPLLTEYNLQPQVSDAQSIVSSIKVLFKHLQEKLSITEAKLKESQYQLMPWRSGGTSPNFAAQSPERFGGAALTSSKSGLELVPRPSYSPANMAISDGQISADWNSRGQHAVHAGASAGVGQNAELDNTGRYSPLASSWDSESHDAPVQVADSRDEFHATHNRQVKFKDPVSSSEVYRATVEGHHNENEDTGTWGSGSSPYSNTLEDPSSSYSPYLQPVPEEPSSSFSEAADDDPLPAIEDLQISGEPFPGRQILACGFSVNGTTSCNFEWVRHLEDGSVKYIDGAKQPVYLVTADDVETYLAIEVQPLDDRKRKGELVRVFANDHRKITCDPAMQSHIEQNLQNGNATYKVSVSTGFLDIWEPATLTIKRDGYSIKGSGSSSVAVNEKLVPGTNVSITHGHPIEFSIDGPSEVVHHLRAENAIPDIASLRDTIVLTLRLFIMKAMQKGKGKRRRMFFSK